MKKIQTIIVASVLVMGIVLSGPAEKATARVSDLNNAIKAAA
jgi:hypothetical protein